MTNLEILKHLSVLSADLGLVLKDLNEFQDKPVFEHAYNQIEAGETISELGVRILNSIELDVDLSAVKKAYRKKALTTHPDKGGTEEMFLKVQWSYKSLTDPSFSYETHQNEPLDLNITLGLSVSFLVALFGSSLKLAVNMEELSSEGVMKVIGESDHKVIFDVGILDVRVPACTRPDDTILVKGAGFKCNGKIGNLTFLMAVEPSPIYTLTEKLDVEMEKFVPLDTLLTGGVVDVSTPYGIKEITIDPGTKPDGTVRLRNIVKRERVEDSKGSMIITLKMDFPDKTVLKKKSIWQRLNIKWQKENKDNVEDMASATWDIFEE